MNFRCNIMIIFINSKEIYEIFNKSWEILILFKYEARNESNTRWIRNGYGPNRTRTNYEPGHERRHEPNQKWNNHETDTNPIRIQTLIRYATTTNPTRTQTIAKHELDTTRGMRLILYFMQHAQYWSFRQKPIGIWLQREDNTKTIKIWKFLISWDFLKFPKFRERNARDTKISKVLVTRDNHIRDFHEEM